MILDPARLKTNFHALVTPKILVNGKIAGTWKREIKGNTVKVVKDLFHPQPGKIMKKIDAALERYSEFIAKKIFRA
jgi:hypothetical protein